YRVWFYESEWGGGGRGVKEKQQRSSNIIEKDTFVVSSPAVDESVDAIRNKMLKAFPLLVRKFPLPEGTSHCLKKNATARRKVLPLLEVCTAIIIKEKPLVKDDSFL
nr:hypothetical protein [Tanacetum cinerariifolium]